MSKKISSEGCGCYWVLGALRSDSCELERKEEKVRKVFVVTEVKTYVV